MTRSQPSASGGQSPLREKIRTSPWRAGVSARAAGASVVDGLEVLVQQGARSFELWTGVTAPVELMRRVVRSRE